MLVCRKSLDDGHDCLENVVQDMWADLELARPSEMFVSDLFAILSTLKHDYDFFGDWHVREDLVNQMPSVAENIKDYAEELFEKLRRPTMMMKWSHEVNQIGN